MRQPHYVHQGEFPIRTYLKVKFELDSTKSIVIFLVLDRGISCLHMWYCACVISQFFINIARRNATSYDVAGLILMSPRDYWRNSTPF